MSTRASSVRVVALNTPLTSDRFGTDAPLPPPSTWIDTIDSAPRTVDTSVSARRLGTSAAAVAEACPGTGGKASTAIASACVASPTLAVISADR